MHRVITAFWFFSVLAFLAVTLYAYGFMENDIVFKIQNDSISTFQLSKSQFFYSALTIFLVSNLVIYSLSHLMKFKLDKLDEESVEYGSKYSLINWLNSFSLVLNIFYALSVIIIAVINNPHEASLGKYAFLAYLGPSLVLIWIVALIYMLFKYMRMSRG